MNVNLVHQDLMRPFFFGTVVEFTFFTPLATVRELIGLYTKT